MKKFLLTLFASVFSLTCARGDAFTGNYAYSGELYRSIAGLGTTTPVGMVTVKAYKVNSAKKTCKVTATIDEAGKKAYKASGVLNVKSDGTLEGTLKGIGGVSWNVGTFDQRKFSAVSSGDGLYAFTARRNYFEGADAKAYQKYIKSYQGIWNAEFIVRPKGPDAPYYFAYLSCAVNNRGIVSVKGWSWDGTKLKGKSKLGDANDGNGCRFVVKVAPFSGNKNGALAFGIRLSNGKMTCATFEDGSHAYAIRSRNGFYSATDEAGCLANALELSEFDGGRGLRLPDGKHVVYSGIYVEQPTEFGFPVLAGLGWPLMKIPFQATGTRWTFPKAGKVTTTMDAGASQNPCGLKLSYSSGTRTFKGYYNLYLLMGTRIKKYRATVNGVCWQPADDTMPRVARGISVCKGPSGKMLYEVVSTAPAE